MDDWEYGRRAVIKNLRELADELDTMQTHFQRSKVAGGAASVAGGIATGALFVASFFTAGLTLPFAIGAGVLSGGGLAISIGAEIGKYIHQSQILKKAQESLDKDNALSKKVLTCVKGLPGAARGSVKIAEIIVDDAGSVVSYASKAANATKLARVSGILGLVILPVDIAFLISDSVKVHNGSVNEAATKLRELANTKERELRECLV